MIYLKRLLYSVTALWKPNRSRTVRYAFPLAFVAAALLGAAVITSDTSSYIRISSNNSNVSAGDSFTIDVYVGAHVAVNAIDIGISFPKDQIEIKGIDTGESVITIWAVDPYVDDNTVILRGGTFRNGFIGEHLVAQINARAKQTGVAKFSADDIQLLAGDGRGSTVSIEDTGYESLTLYVGTTNTNDTNADGTSAGGAVLEGTVKVGLYTDIDGDGNVDMSDIRSFMSAWRFKTANYDFNGDGRMTFVDFAIILADSFFN